MSSIHLFSLAHRHINFLNARQMTVSQNIANMSTPGYRSVDLKPFKDVVDGGETSLKATHSAHIHTSLFESQKIIRTSGSDGIVQLSGNNVNIENELMKSGEVRRLYDLTSSSMKAFQRMYLASVK